MSIKKNYREGELMLSVVVINPNHEVMNVAKKIEYIDFCGINIPFGILELQQPKFDILDEKNKDFVLVKINCFSCNYRDKAIILNNFFQLQKLNKPFLPFGSEFSGTVVLKGKNVSELEIGDSVISNCTYEGLDNNEFLPGVATNYASLGWLRIRKEKLIKKPIFLNSVQAASFSLGAQTAFSMIKKSGILEFDNPNPIIFSSRSTTSLFIIQILQSFGINPICCSRKRWNKNELQTVDIGSNISNGELDNFTNSITHVFDPFFDINLTNATNVLSYGGKYVCCGLLNQLPSSTYDKSVTNYMKFADALKLIVVKNLSLIGNCLGKLDDLVDVIKLFNECNMVPIIDSEYTIEKKGYFIRKSFFDNEKFGKCVMNYEISNQKTKIKILN